MYFNLKTLFLFSLILIFIALIQPKIFAYKGNIPPTRRKIIVVAISLYFIFSSVAGFIAGAIGISLRDFERGICLFDCKLNIDEIGKQVKMMAQQELDQNPEFKNYHLSVTKIDVIHENGNKYRGSANISMDGKEHSVPIDILYDGDKMMWEAKPGSFSFIAEKEIEKAQDDIDKLIKEVEKDFEEPNVADLDQITPEDVDTLNSGS